MVVVVIARRLILAAVVVAVALMRGETHLRSLLALLTATALAQAAVRQQRAAPLLLIALPSLQRVAALEPAAA